MDGGKMWWQSTGDAAFKMLRCQHIWVSKAKRDNVRMAFWQQVLSPCVTGPSASFPHTAAQLQEAADHRKAIAVRGQRAVARPDAHHRPPHAALPGRQELLLGVGASICGKTERRVGVRGRHY